MYSCRCSCPCTSRFKSTLLVLDCAAAHNLSTSSGIFEHQRETLSRYLQPLVDFVLQRSVSSANGPWQLTSDGVKPLPISLFVTPLAHILCVGYFAPQCPFQRIWIWLFGEKLILLNFNSFFGTNGKFTVSYRVLFVLKFILIKKQFYLHTKNNKAVHANGCTTLSLLHNVRKIRKDNTHKKKIFRNKEN